MPVYERGYTHWERSDGEALPAWLIIAKRGIAEPLKKRRLLVLLLASWVPAIVKAIMIYVKLRAGDVADLLAGGWSSIDAGGFLTFIEGQHLFVFVLLAIVGAGLIADDRRDNGLSLYFSRPLDMVGYVAGKSLVVWFYYALVTLLPVCVLCVFGYLIAPGATGLDLLLLTPLRTFVYTMLSGMSMSLVLLAFSSLGKRPVFVMVWWAIMVMGTASVGAIAEGLGQSQLQMINFLGQYHNAGALVFGVEPRLPVSSWLSLAVVAAWTGAALLVLNRQIRPVEVVV